MKKSILLALAALVTVSALAAAGRQPREGDDGANLLVTLGLAGIGGEGEHRIQALVLDGERSRLATGWRVPIARAADSDCEGAAGSPVSYQNVGLGVTLHTRIVAAGGIRVHGEVELSSIAPEETAPVRVLGAPTVASFRHVFDVIVAEGARTIVAEAPDAEGGTVVLTLTAEVQR